MVSGLHIYIKIDDGASILPIVCRCSNETAVRRRSYCLHDGSIFLQHIGADNLCRNKGLLELGYDGEGGYGSNNGKAQGDSERVMSGVDDECQRGDDGRREGYCGS